MAPRRKPVVEPEDIVQNWEYRAPGGRSTARQSWAHKIARADAPEPREAPRPLVEVKRAFPPLAVIYEQAPAYAVAGPPERKTL